MENQGDKLDYNEEPVYYCRHCLSLKIRHVPKLEDSDYCDSCGSTNIEQCNILDWERLYINKFGHKFIDTY